MRLAAPVLAAILPLAACAVPSSEGSGPVTLSPQVQAAYAHYRRLPTPLAFDVSTAGTGCPRPGPAPPAPTGPPAAPATARAAPAAATTSTRRSRTADARQDLLPDR